MVASRAGRADEQVGTGAAGTGGAAATGRGGGAVVGGTTVVGGGGAVVAGGAVVVVTGGSVVVVVDVVVVLDRRGRGTVDGDLRPDGVVVRGGEGEGRDRPHQGDGQQGGQAAEQAMATNADEDPGPTVGDGRVSHLPRLLPTGPAAIPSVIPVRESCGSAGERAR